MWLLLSQFNERMAILGLKKEKTEHNTAYSLWRVKGCQQGFRSVASFGFGGQESAPKPPQAICKTLGFIKQKLNE